MAVLGVAQGGQVGGVGGAGPNVAPYTTCRREEEREEEGRGRDIRHTAVGRAEREKRGGVRGG